MFYPTAVLAIQYPVKLTYQHGSAIPDTFSMLPATRFLPPLQFPDLQHPEAAQYAHWLFGADGPGTISSVFASGATGAVTV